MKIIFVRHGHYKNKKLTRLGKKQSKNICYDLIDENIGAIYSSPEIRAIQTAKIIAKKLKINNIFYDDDLRERIDLKNPKNEKELEYYNNYLNADYSSNNPEGCKEFLERSFRFLNKIVKKHKNINVLIVGHSCFSYAILAYLAGIPKNRNLIWTRVGNCSKICYEL